MAKLIEQYYEKNYYDNKRYVLETKIWLVEDARYPSGVKYSLVFIDTRSGKKVLLDNHHPKGPHVHLDDVEFEYEFTNEKRLILDFKAFVYQHFGVKL